MALPLFTDVNADRPRVLIRGRVIVFTTSLHVEFLEENLKVSYPLYSIDSFAPGYGLSFMVELNGYLTFDRESVVRVSPELNTFTCAYYDPTAFAVVQAGDEPTISFVNSYYNGPARGASYVTVAISRFGNPAGKFNLYCVTPFNTQDEFTAWVTKTFPKAGVWHGDLGYSSSYFTPDPYG